MDGKTFAYRKEIPVSADRGGRFDFDNTTALWYTKKDVIGLTAYQFTAEVTPLDKYEYKIRFSTAVCIVKCLLTGGVSPPAAEMLIRKNLSPVRPNRGYPRKKTPLKAKIQFAYRIA